VSRPAPTPRDRIAREAARLFETGRVPTIRRAIERAAADLGLQGTAPPSEGRVRQHLEAMSMQALGEAGHRGRVGRILRIAEELMTAMEEMAGVEALLVGRAARGQVEGEPRLHVRLYTSISLDELARRLEDLGYGELSCLNRIVFVEDGVELVVTRCPPALRASARQNLYTGAPVEVATLAELRKLLPSVP
jgi:hypothetical protein